MHTVLATCLLATCCSTSTEPACANADALRLVPHEVADPGIGRTAMRMLVPKSWTVQGGIHWQLQYANLATGALTVTSPSGSAAFESFPLVPYVWASAGIPFFPEGSVYLGSEVRPPASSPEEFVHQFVLPAHRPAARDVRVVERERLDAVAESSLWGKSEPGVHKEARGQRIRVEYTEGERRIEEDFYCVLLFSTTPYMPGWTNWGADRLVSMRAETGQLDTHDGLLQTMLASVVIDPAWMQGYLQVVDMYRQGQLDSIRRAGDLSRYIAKVGDEISEMTRQTWTRQQESNDRVMREFSEAIRGVETYSNPFGGGETELPSGYRDVWVSSSGEYVLSDDALFDPNEGSIVEWRRMDARR